MSAPRPGRLVLPLVAILASLAGSARANVPPVVRVTNPLTFTLTQGAFTTQVQAVERAQDAASFYNYYSASSHTGFEAAHESKVFLYRDTTTGALSLFFTHNIDRNPGDPSTGSGSVTLDLSGVPAGAFVAQSDDPFQGGRAELDLFLDPEGFWNYGDNTDGGVVDGLPADQPWCITITPLRFSNVASWVYHYASGTSIPLDQAEPVEICLVPSTDVNTLDTDEGNDVSLSGEFDDADASDSHSASWDFGDGGTAPAVVTPGPGVTHHDVAPVFHRFGDDGTFPALLTVTDSAGESGSDTVTVRVHNVSPAATIVGPVATSIGMMTALTAAADDPGSDDLTFTWDYGDGSPSDVHPHYNDGASPDPIPSAAGNFPFSASDDAAHFWCEAGTYTVTVTVADDDGGTDIVTTIVTVAPTPMGEECNEPPVCEAGAYPAQLCGDFLLSAATASDPDGDPLTFTWMADCDGDGLFGDWNGFSDASALNPSFTPPDPCGSACTLRLVVFDGLESCESFTDIAEDDTLAPTVTAGSIDACHPSVAAAEAAAIAATTASDNCSAVVTLSASTAGTCSAIITVTATDDCLNTRDVSYATRIDDAPPVVSAPAPLVLECTSPGGVPSSDARVVAWLAGASASDDCGSASPPSDDVPAFLNSGCAPGTPITVTFTSQDDCGNVGTATSTLTVVDTTPPSVSAPAPLALECNSAGGVLASDPAVIAWLASASASDTCGSASSPANDAPGLFASGCVPGSTTTVTFTSQDGCGNVGTATSTLTVVDTTPPVISPGSGGNLCLWPPSHDWICFDRGSFHPAISDSCDVTPLAWRFLACASSQPEDGLGDGHTAPDCVVSPDGAQICVRSERQGMVAEGRTYAVSIEAVDSCGNASVEHVGDIRVPRDQREIRDCTPTPTPRGPKKGLPF